MRQFTIELDEAQVQAVDFYGSLFGLTVEQAMEYMVLKAVELAIFAGTRSNLNAEEIDAVNLAEDARIIARIKAKDSGQARL